MKVLVIGRQGQIARSLILQGASSQHEFVARGRPGLDITQTGHIEKAINEIKPDIVINAAAYTAVDKAETDEDAAFLLNGKAAGQLAHQTAQLDIPIIQLSTDYVFDGAHDQPYFEQNPVAPIGVYGRSKLAGEELVQANNPQHLIIRTAWVFSPFGNNFVKTMLRLAETKDEIGVVDDQFGNPTYAVHIADGLIKILDQLGTGQPPHWGIFHMAGRSHTSWADMAERIFEASKVSAGPTARINRISTAQFPTPARRPVSSRLDTTRLFKEWGVELPDWHEGVDDCVAKLLVKTEYNGKVVT